MKKFFFNFGKDKCNNVDTDNDYDNDIDNNENEDNKEYKKNEDDVEKDHSNNLDLIDEKICEINQNLYNLSTIHNLSLSTNLGNTMNTMNSSINNTNQKVNSISITPHMGTSATIKLRSNNNSSTTKTNERITKSIVKINDINKNTNIFSQMVTDVGITGNSSKEI